MSLISNRSFTQDRRLFLKKGEKDCFEVSYQLGKQVSQNSILTAAAVMVRLSGFVKWKAKTRVMADPITLSSSFWILCFRNMNVLEVPAAAAALRNQHLKTRVTSVTFYFLHLETWVESNKSNHLDSCLFLNCFQRDSRFSRVAIRESSISSRKLGGVLIWICDWFCCINCWRTSANYEVNRRWKEHTV